MTATRTIETDYAGLYNTLSSTAQAVLSQLFTEGPTSDGNIIAPAGRNELVHYNLVFRTDGWSSLTPAGVRLAIALDVRQYLTDAKWQQKLQRT